MTLAPHIIEFTEFNPHSWLDMAIVKFNVTDQETGEKQQVRMYLDSETMIEMINQMTGYLNHLVDKHQGIKDNPKLKEFFEKHGVKL